MFYLSSLTDKDKSVDFIIPNNLSTYDSDTPHIHACTYYTHAHTHTYACTHAHMHTCTQTLTHTHTYTRMDVHAHTHT